MMSYKEAAVKGRRVKHRIRGQGRVIGFDGSAVCIEYDKFNEDLHDGNGVRKVVGKMGHCWWEFPAELEPGFPKQLENK